MSLVSENDAKFGRDFAAATGGAIASSAIVQIFEQLKELNTGQTTLNEAVKQIAKMTFSQIAQLAASFALLQMTTSLYAAGPLGIIAGTMISSLGGYAIGQGVQLMSDGMFGA